MKRFDVRVQHLILLGSAVVTLVWGYKHAKHDPIAALSMGVMLVLTVWYMYVNEKVDDKLNASSGVATDS